LKFGAVNIGRAARAAAAANSKARIVLSRRESVTQYFRCARERYIGEGAFVVREHGISASPMTISFVTFLFGNKKVTLSQV
jgi:hypothetical protein